MKFNVKTLIDITQTDARRGEDPYELKQQQNFLTFTQTLGLRTNPYFTKPPVISDTVIDNVGFGKSYKGKHKMWEFEFNIEFEGGLDVERLVEDFDIVPVISGLDETIDLKDPCFRSKDSKLINIIFGIDDK